MNGFSPHRIWLFRQCATSTTAERIIGRVRPRGFQPAQKRLRISSWASDDQAIPLTGYYAELLQPPDHSVAPSRRIPTVESPAEWLPKSVREETLAKAQAVFGSRLASQAQRENEKRSTSQLIQGVLVPPKPIEPDNCCMSGCVNCVWDLYRDDMEEWAAKSSQARARLPASQQSGGARGIAGESQATPSHVDISMDDDGGGRETNWPALTTGDTSEDLFDGIPVGIREFMKTEKMLKQKTLKAG